MCASETMMMLVEVHHLKSIELLRDLPDLLFLPRLLNLNAMRIPYISAISHQLQDGWIGSRSLLTIG